MSSSPFQLFDQLLLLLYLITHKPDNVRVLRRKWWKLEDVCIPPTLMNGFKFFMLGLDFPPRTAIGCFWIVTDDPPENEIHYQKLFHHWILYLVSSQKVGGCFWSPLGGIY